MATNVLRIVNRTRSNQVLTINISMPDGWELFTKLDKKIELLPQDIPPADPLGADLGGQRILRTSALTPVPAIC